MTSGNNLGVPLDQDTRAHVNPTNVAPAFWIGQIRSTYAGNVNKVSTGTLISPRHVLSCAHAIYSHEHGWATAVQFSLALNAATRPYGAAVAATLIHTPKGFQDLPQPAPDVEGLVAAGTHEKYLEDYGLVTLESDLDPAGGTFPQMYAASDAELADRTIELAGYPGDKKPNGSAKATTMWSGEGNLLESSQRFLYYGISTYRGQSGSSVRSMFPASLTPQVLGIHVAGDLSAKRNFAVRLTEDVIANVAAWMKQAPADG